MRAAAQLDDRRVAGAQANLLDRQLEAIGEDLRKGGLVALPGRLRAAYGDERVALPRGRAALRLRAAKPA